MSTESDRQLVKVLESIVHELRGLQTAGWMRDAESRAHVEFLERGLRRAQARLAGRDAPPNRRGMWAS
ncbi:MAG: hypothetical protein J2P38_04550 [Candidatus Dormibacteraeota bacterium]|nr:hypothetical protein [Candidatus Dormibacteraeota bacterium]